MHACSLIWLRGVEVYRHLSQPLGSLGPLAAFVVYKQTEELQTKQEELNNKLKKTFIQYSQHTPAPTRCTDTTTRPSASQTKQISLSLGFRV